MQIGKLMMFVPIITVCIAVLLAVAYFAVLGTIQMYVWLQFLLGG